MVYIARSDQFLTEVSKLYDACSDKRSVWVTFKKYIPHVPKPKSKQQLEKSQQGAKEETSLKSVKKIQKKSTKQQEGCLVRVTDGKKKISTVVTQKDLATFQIHLFNVLKQKFSHLHKKKEIEIKAVSSAPATANQKKNEEKQKTSDTKKVKSTRSKKNA
jgi:signal recognition particle subunit SRP14